MPPGRRNKRTYDDSVILESDKRMKIDPDVNFVASRIEEFYKEKFEEEIATIRKAADDILNKYENVLTKENESKSTNVLDTVDNFTNQLKNGGFNSVPTAEASDVTAIKTEQKSLEDKIKDIVDNSRDQYPYFASLSQQRWESVIEKLVSHFIIKFANETDLTQDMLTEIEKQLKKTNNVYLAKQKSKAA